MDRESFDVSVLVSRDGRPRLAVDVSDATADVAGRLVGPDGDGLPAADLDVTYRETASRQPGVLGLANRLTGEFVLEVGLDEARLDDLVEAVLADGDEPGRYELSLTDQTGATTTYEMETLLVYDEDGNLLRNRSLIPGGVEL